MHRKTSLNRSAGADWSGSGAQLLRSICFIAALAAASLNVHAHELKEFKLPPGTARLSYYGERPAWSPDGRKVAFVGRSLGDAFEVDIANRETRNLTGHFPHAGFFRVQYLSNGDLLLTGPRSVNAAKNLHTARWKDTEMWLLDKSLRAPALPLGQTLFEGAAVSTRTPRIAWSQLSPEYQKIYASGENAPGRFSSKDPNHYTTFHVADIVYGAQGPTLANAREVARIPLSECRAETQDFRDEDREIIYSCMRSTARTFAGPMDWATLGLRIDTGKTVTYRSVKNTGWEEVEGIAPDGSWTLIECGPEKRQGEVIIDLCRLNLAPSRPELTRLTHFIEQGGSASNGVISPDGKWMAFMEVTDRFREPGTGDGILLMPLP